MTVTTDDPRLAVAEPFDPPTSEPVGVQVPTHFYAPTWSTTAGDDAVDLAAACGLKLLPWQQLVLRNALGEYGNKWDAFEVGLIVPRQNGKNVVLLARQLAGLFLFDEEQQVHTAHKFKTAQSAYRDLRKVIEKAPDLLDMVKGFPQSSDQTAIILKNGCRIDFLARFSGGGRGLSGDTVYLDEAFALDPVIVSDLLPTLSARPCPQLWYTSSTGFETSDVLRDVRERALEGEDRDRRHLAFFEWSADEHLSTGEDYATPEAAAVSNPSLGWFQSWEWIESVDLRGMTEEAYRRERLGIWADAEEDRAIPAEVWRITTAGPEVVRSSTVVRRSIGLDVTADRDLAVLAGATELSNGTIVVDVIAARRGVAWVADECKRMNQRHSPYAGVVVDSMSGAFALTTGLQAAGVPFSLASTRDLTSGTAKLYDGLSKQTDGVSDPTVLHGTNPYLDDAAYTATRRLVGTSKTQWTWKESGEVPVAPLRAVTLALQGLSMEPVKKRRGSIA